MWMWWLRFVGKLLWVLNPMVPRVLNFTYKFEFPFKGCFYHPCCHLFQSCHFYLPHVVYTDRWMRVNNQEVLVSNLRSGCSQGLLLSCMGWERFNNKNNLVTLLQNDIEAYNRFKLVKTKPAGTVCWTWRWIRRRCGWVGWWCRAAE